MTLRNTFALRACLGLPYVALVYVGVIYIHPICLAGLLPPVLLVMETVGKYPTLAVAWALWLGFLSVVAGAMPLWVGIVVLAAATLSVTLLVVVVGRDWGQRRYARMAARGRPMREWEWVYVGRSFARAHDLHRVSPMIWLMALGVSACMAAIWLQFYLAPTPTHPALWLAIAAVYSLTLLALLRLWPVAYPLVFLALAPGFPLTLPFIFYWADGVRPNLIYRHRFERLIPKERL